MAQSPAFDNQQRTTGALGITPGQRARLYPTAPAPIRQPLCEATLNIVSKAGAVLEATYQAVVGLSGGYEALTGLLSKFFPIGETPWLPFDDPFLLADGNQWSVYTIV